MELPRRCPRCGAHRVFENVKAGVSYFQCRKCGWLDEGDVRGKPYRTERYLGDLASGRFLK